MHKHTRINAEEWRPVVGYEGLYEVSDNGRVKSVARTVPHGRHGSVRVREKIIHQVTKESGHRRVGLTVGRKKVSYYAHRLVLEAFVGPCPAGMECCHSNGNPADNRVENLRWDTRWANQQDRFDHGTVYQFHKTHCPRGHVLAGKNLKPDAARKGYRSCLSCARARNRKSNMKRRYGMEMGDQELQRVSDDYYRSIMS